MIHKNIKASLNTKEFTDAKKACMYSTTNDCPVKAFKKYLKCLPEVTKDNVLFPQITKTVNVSSSVVMGKKQIRKLHEFSQSKVRIE